MTTEHSHAESLRRGDALKTAAVASASLAAGGLIAAALPAFADTPPATDEDTALDLLLELELLLEKFYAAGSDLGTQSGGKIRDFIYTAQAHEQTHVRLIRKLRGNRPEPSAEYDFSSATTDTETFLAATTTLEDIVVGAYNGQLRHLSSNGRHVAGRIGATTARHAVWAGKLGAGSVAFDTPADPAHSVDETRAALAKLGYRKGGG